MTNTVRARGFAKPALVNSKPAAFRPSGFDPARIERCDYCRTSRHVCGCEDRFEYEQIRDNPTLLAR